jgi:hypothetical protein
MRYPISHLELDGKVKFNMYRIPNLSVLLHPCSPHSSYAEADKRPWHGRRATSSLDKEWQRYENRYENLASRSDSRASFLFHGLLWPGRKDRGERWNEI